MGNRRDYHENEPFAQGSEKVHDSKHDRHAHQKGPQVHAEGEHGSATHRRHIEQLESGEPEESVEPRLARARVTAGRRGERRLVEDRQQHDEAEKNSEQNRLMKEYEHDRADDGPVDTTNNLQGFHGSDNRADYRLRGTDGLPID